MAYTSGIPSDLTEDPSGSGHNIPRSDNGNEYTITISLTKYLVAIPIVVDSSTVGAVESSTLNEYIDLIYLLVKLNGMSYLSHLSTGRRQRVTLLPSLILSFP
uniref:HDC07646 n=1 Tax=Drosophila melanogaster TaxID=7227 RepID=Q6IM29_DROME|nr:TPA_inf: HDC07646 [Drosophila melanogaster]